MPVHSGGLHSATCSTASLAPWRGLSGSTFTSAVCTNTCSSDTRSQAVRAPWLRGEEGMRANGSFYFFHHQLTSRVTKRACSWGLSGFTLTVWLALNSCRSASLLQAWIAPWPADRQVMRGEDAGDRTAINQWILGNISQKLLWKRCHRVNTASPTLPVRWLSTIVQQVQSF